MKFYGVIGFGPTREVRPGVWEEEIVERNYYGELQRTSRHSQSNGQVNDDLILTHNFSIIADPYAFQNFAFIRYVCWQGIKWKVSSVEILHPRIIIQAGGVYH